MPQAAAAPRRWRRRPDARPDEILDAALDAFIERGFDAARMEDIAARAGLSKAAIYLYFDAKDALLRALISREVAPIAARAQALARSGAVDPEAGIRAIAAAAFAALSNPRIFAVPRLVIAVAGRFPEIAAHYRSQVIDPARGALITLVEAGVARGTFRDVDPDAAVRAIIGPVMFEVMWRFALGGEPRDGEARLAENWADLLLRGLKAERQT